MRNRSSFFGHLRFNEESLTMNPHGGHVTFAHDEETKHLEIGIVGSRLPDVVVHLSRAEAKALAQFLSSHYLQSEEERKEEIRRAWWNR